MQEFTYKHDSAFPCNPAPRRLMEHLNVSASQLLKRSAAQYLFLLLNPDKKEEPTPAMYVGNAHADTVTPDSAIKEARGRYVGAHATLWFCLDFYDPQTQTAVEIKHVDPDKEYPDWYFQQAQLQSILYATLAQRDFEYDTPKFLVDQGQPYQKHGKLPVTQFELWFGNDKYTIRPNEAVLNFYLLKLGKILNGRYNSNYKQVRAWDTKYKHKEYVHLEEFVDYSPIDKSATEYQL